MYGSLYCVRIGDLGLNKISLTTQRRPNGRLESLKTCKSQGLQRRIADLKSCKYESVTAEHFSEPLLEAVLRRAEALALRLLIPFSVSVKCLLVKQCKIQGGHREHVTAPAWVCEHVLKGVITLVNKRPWINPELLGTEGSIAKANPLFCELARAHLTDLGALETWHPVDMIDCINARFGVSGYEFHGPQHSVTVNWQRNVRNNFHREDIKQQHLGKDLRDLTAQWVADQPEDDPEDESPESDHSVAGETDDDYVAPTSRGVKATTRRSTRSTRTSGKRYGEPRRRRLFSDLHGQLKKKPYEVAARSMFDYDRGPPL